MQYGHFDDNKREYVITKPDTPRPWSNYLGSADFGSVITNHAGGYTFYKSAAQGRLSRFRFNGPTSDMPGKYIYLRDNESADFWSNGWMPVRKDIEAYEYECRFGTGYACLDTAFAHIRTQTSYFIPMGKTYEVWQVTLTNEDSRERTISAFPFIETQNNWNALDDGMNLQYTQYIAKAEVEGNMIDLGSNINMPEDPEHFENKDQKRHMFFILHGADASGFDTDREMFLGDYGSYGDPEAVVQGRCSNSVVSGDNPCGAFQVDMKLAAGESRSFILLFGVGRAVKEGQEAVSEMENTAQQHAALDRVKDYWHSKLNTLFTETPNELFNSMVNTWAPYNNLMTFYWSRTASLVYAGERDGLGFRDTVQDICGTAGLILEESRKRLELMITGQLANGGAMPVVKPFAHRPGHEQEADHYRADDGLWFFNAIPEYVKESGDLDFYNKVLPYADIGEDTVFGHLRRAIEFNLERCGKHGIPCGLAADWNDCIRLGEHGESIFVAFQLRLALREYTDIAQRLNETDEARWATEQLAGLDAILDAHAWDGEWFMRAYRADGFKFGSHESEEGKIFMNPQTWAVLSGHATGERAEQIMESMNKHLLTEYGIMVCTPPYLTTDAEICRARLMNPGMKENGGVFNHTQGWAVMAAAELGMNDLAWQYMSAVMPANFNDNAEVREVEPYVVCQSTHSSSSPRYGSGRVSWLSGSAVWNYYAMTHAILGIQPAYEGLKLDPCLPSDWPEVNVQRTFRGKHFQIVIRNGKKGKGVRQVTLNGEAIEGNVITMDKAKEDNRVEVALL